MELGLGHRDLIAPLAIDVVRHADRDLLEAGEDIEFGEEGVGEAIDAACEARDRCVEPAATASAPSGDTALAADDPQALAIVVEQLGREGAGSDAGRVGLEDADDPGDAGRPDAAAGACAASGGVARGDERVGAVVDVEQGALPPLEEHDLVFVECLVQHERSVGDVWLKDVGERKKRIDDLVDLERAAVVDLDEHLVLARQRTFDLLAQDRRVEQVLHADAEAGDLVAVGRTDAASGRADLRVAEEALGHLVEGDVVGSDEMRIGADDEFRGIDASLVEGSHLMEQDGRIDHHAVADNRDDLGSEDAGRQEMEGELLVADDDGVAGVVAALVANDIVDAATEEIGCLALAFIAPLRPDENDCGHGQRLQGRPPGHPHIIRTPLAPVGEGMAEKVPGEPGGLDPGPARPGIAGESEPDPLVQEEGFGRRAHGFRVGPALDGRPGRGLVDPEDALDRPERSRQDIGWALEVAGGQHRLHVGNENRFVGAASAAVVRNPGDDGVVVDEHSVELAPGGRLVDCRDRDDRLPDEFAGGQHGVRELRSRGIDHGSSLRAWHAQGCRLGTLTVNEDAVVVA